MNGSQRVKMITELGFDGTKKSRMILTLSFLLLFLITMVPGVNATEGDPPLRPAIEETAEIFQTQNDNHQEGNLRQEVQENVKTCTRTFKNCDPSKTNCILETPCRHGSCNELGYCVCEPCWDGESCDDLLDTWAPSFESREASVVVTNPWDDQPIYTAVAPDR
ncbi:uncharacterized protein LOC111246399 [Varroa destructor]|uniref:EGF-like domain-containing protein n=1 Tax=Varroa destructor TaxID=109461 RepID=A0A7M7JGC9_VARDE|nr:uncharacterized protein LOC111246399 [Varroa destructor]